MNKTTLKARLDNTYRFGKLCLDPDAHHSVVYYREALKAVVNDLESIYKDLEEK